MFFAVVYHTQLDKLSIVRRTSVVARKGYSILGCHMAEEEAVSQFDWLQNRLEEKSRAAGRAAEAEAWAAQCADENLDPSTGEPVVK